MSEPVIIQGGMGAGVSNWKLAKAVSLAGHLGVVSGTALDSILARRLQMGDHDGSMRRALAHFPDQAFAQKILERYFIPGGKPAEAAFKNIPILSLNPSQEALELNVAANFAEVYLAKEGHSGFVGINYLEKVQIPTLSCLYGALLAGVDYILMGAGIPRAIPGIIDRLILHEEVSLKVAVQGPATADDGNMAFRPKDIVPMEFPALKRPRFIAIVASVVLAQTLAKKSTGHVDGFIIEGPTAGGHNAPPRGDLQLTAKGEPLYGPKDEVDVAKIKQIGLPFWLAGSYADPDKLAEALSQGAAGIQVGTVFAYCDESGLMDSIKKQVLRKALRSQEGVFTDPLASPTGFPFKVVQLENTLSGQSEYESRPRICDLGYLRTAFKQKNGTVGYRCASEPVDQYVQKEGFREETTGRKCLCNGLMSNIGLGQNQKSGYKEKPLVTSGDDLGRILNFLKDGRLSYKAADVIQYLLGSLKNKGELPILKPSLHPA
jgi:nitronate monooxygenase